MDKNFVSKTTIDNKKKAKTEYLKEKLKKVFDNYILIKFFLFFFFFAIMLLCNIIIRIIFL